MLCAGMLELGTNQPSPTICPTRCPPLRRPLQAGVYKNVLHAAQSIVKAAGVRGLFTVRRAANWLNTNLQLGDATTAAAQCAAAAGAAACWSRCGCDVAWPAACWLPNSLRAAACWLPNNLRQAGCWLPNSCCRRPSRSLPSCRRVTSSAGLFAHGAGGRARHGRQVCGVRNDARRAHEAAGGQQEWGAVRAGPCWLLQAGWGVRGDARRAHEALATHPPAPNTHRPCRRTAAPPTWRKT